MASSLRLLDDTSARACGIGEGTNACAYLLVAPDGFNCAQRSALADSIYNRVRDGLSLARRTPEQDFPACQAESRI
jgi:hypothetical protein